MSSSIHSDITGGPVPAKRPMTERQAYALRHPVTSLSGMLDRSYARTIKFGDVHMDTVLTVMVSGNEAAWCASISVMHPDGQPLPVAQAGEAALDFVRAELEKMLEGVGVASESRFSDNGGVALYLARPLTDEERARVKVPWANANLN
jgi:hypothetical protein